MGETFRFEKEMMIQPMLFRDTLIGGTVLVHQDFCLSIQGLPENNKAITIGKWVSTKLGNRGTI